MSFHGPNTRILGLMQSQFQFESQANTYTASHEGAKCFWVQKIRVVLRYVALDIFVAKEYESHSCESRVILEHEEQHVRTAKRVIEPYVPQVKSVLTSLSIPRADDPMEVDSTEEGEERLWQIVRKLITPVRNDLNEKLAREQAKVDSPQSYALVRKRCRNW